MSDLQEDSMRLTQAAGEVLDRVLADVRLQILNRASQYAAAPEEETVEVTARDIRSAAEDIVYSTRRRPRSTFTRVLRRALLLYALLGVLISVGGFGVFAFQSLNIHLTTLQGQALLFSVLGVMLAVVSFVLMLYLDSVRDRTGGTGSSSSPSVPDVPAGMGSSDAFLRAWRELEGALRRAAEATAPSQDRALSRVLAVLNDAGRISDSDVVAIRQLLAIRNATVHGGREPNDDEYESAAARARSLTEQIEEPT